MIKIERTTCPPLLENYNTPRDLYKRKEVVKALSKMQHSKCCYCEQRIPDEGHSRAVEHFRPRDKFQSLKNKWGNLLHACAMCNGKKSNYFPIDSNGKPLLIDPSDKLTDPEDHLDFIVDDEDVMCGMIQEKNNSKLGRETIKTIGLEREDYRKKRRDHLKKLYAEYLELAFANDRASKRAIKIKFESLMGANADFAAFTRKFAREKKLDEKYEIKIPSGYEIPNDED